MTIDSLKHIGNKSSGADVVIHEIEDACNKISKQRGLEKLEIYTLVKSLLLQSPTDEELQSSLFDILGFDEFDLISKIIQNKRAFATRESLGLMSSEERAQQVIDNHQRAKNQTLLPKSTHQKYPNVFKNPDVGNIISITGKKFALPQGTTRDSYATHEELVIPYPENKPNKWILEKNLVKISDLNFLCQGTFKNYKNLNKMQSLVYPVAYNTNENMLVCAPTGAGKTDVALLTILHTINQFVTETVTEDGDVSVDIDYDEFKIVYVAPLKALAAEIVEKYSKNSNG